MKQHNIAFTVNSKVTTLSYNTGIRFLTLLQFCWSYPELDCHVQHFLEFGDIFGFYGAHDRPLTFPQTLSLDNAYAQYATTWKSTYMVAQKSKPLSRILNKS